MRTSEKLADALRDAFKQNPVFSWILNMSPILLILAVVYGLANSIFYDVITSSGLFTVIGYFAGWFLIFGGLGSFALGKVNLCFVCYTAYSTKLLIDIIRNIILIVNREFKGYTIIDTVLKFLVYGFFAYVMLNIAFPSKTKMKQVKKQEQEKNE